MPSTTSPIDSLMDGMRRICNSPAAPHHRPTAPHTPDQTDEPQPDLPTVPAPEGRHDPAGEAGGGLLPVNEPPAALANLSPLTAAVQDRSASVSWDSMSSNAAAVHEHAACHVGAVRPLTGTSYVPFAPQPPSAVAPEMPPARAAAVGFAAAAADKPEVSNAAAIAIGTAGAAPCYNDAVPIAAPPAAEPPSGPACDDMPDAPRGNPGTQTPPAPEAAFVYNSDTFAAPANAHAAAHTTRSLARAPVTGAISDLDPLQQTPAVLCPATQVARDRPTPSLVPAAGFDNVHDPNSDRGPATGSSRRSLEGAFLSAANSAPPAAAEQPVWLSQAAACCAAVDTSVDTSDVDYIDQLEHQVHTLKRANEQLTTEARAAQAACSRATARTSHAALADPPTRSVRRRAGAELSDYCSGADVARSSRRRVDGGPRAPSEPTPCDWDDRDSAPLPSHAPPPPPPPPPSGPPHRFPAPAAVPDPLSGLVPDPACALVVAPPRRPPSAASDPPLDPPSADHLVAFHPPSQPQQPAWYAPVVNSSGVIVTAPLLPWRQSVALAPQTPALAKLRAQQSPANPRLCALLTSMVSHPGMVASTYTRVIQLLVDQYCTLFYLNNSEIPSVLNAEVHRFLADACMNIDCSEIVRTCYLESSTAFPEQPDVDVSMPTYMEELVHYVLRMIVLELAPPFHGTLEVTFNRNTRLRVGDTINDLLKSMRKAASEGTIPEHVVKSRLVAIVQEAANHPDVDRHVLNSVTGYVTEMMARSTSVHALQQTVVAAASVGGYLTEPIIRPAPAPPPVLAPASPLVPAGGFLASAAANSPEAASPPSPAGPPGPTAFYAPPQGGDRRPLRTAYDLSRAYLLFFGPDASIPPIRGSLDCRVCTELDQKTLVTWYEGCERPKPESKQKFGHDPWCCAAVGYHMQQRRAAGDARFTEALCRGVLGKPATAADFPQE